MYLSRKHIRHGNLTIGKSLPIDISNDTEAHLKKPLANVREKVTAAFWLGLWPSEKISQIFAIFFNYCIANSNIIRIFAVQTKVTNPYTNDMENYSLFVAIHEKGGVK